MKTPDTQYRDLLATIMRDGVEVKPIQDEKAKMLFGYQMHYLLKNGFPLVTERDMSGPLVRGALAEHVAFLHGARTQADLVKWGCKWWDRWVTKERCDIFGLPEGDLGDGSYGAAWTSFPTKDGGSFNQIEALMRQMKDMPSLRTHLISPWIPQYTFQWKDHKRRVVVAPCHGWVHVVTFPETKELSVHHFQRSADAPVGLIFNMAQYAAFGMVLAQMLGYTLKEVVYTLSDVHIYESQYGKVEELLAREPRTLPDAHLDPSVMNLLDFRPEHLTFTDYNPHPKMGIPTPV